MKCLGHCLQACSMLPSLQHRAVCNRSMSAISTARLETASRKTSTLLYTSLAKMARASLPSITSLGRHLPKSFPPALQHRATLPANPKPKLCEANRKAARNTQLHPNYSTQMGACTGEGSRPNTLLAALASSRHGVEACVWDWEVLCQEFRAQV